MQTIKRLFRNSYDGEEVFSSAIYTNGSWMYEKEYVAKVLNNYRFGKSAVVIGNGVDRLKFDLNNLKKNQIQTYGCNALYRDFNPDFLVVTGPDVVEEIISSNYCDTHVVYSNIGKILDYPGKFHLIPQDPNWNAGAITAYLACFDGHAQVYLLGHDGNDTYGMSNNVYANTNGYNSVATDSNDTFWSLTMSHVFKTYPLVDFVLVNSSGRGYIPESWQGFTNLRRIDFRQFVIECDL
jgi:hypothetical protein